MSFQMTPLGKLSTPHQVESKNYTQANFGLSSYGDESGKVKKGDHMNDLVTLKNNDCFTDSKIIADGTGNKHRSIQRLIETHKASLERFGKVRFEITPSGKTNQNQNIYQLNEQQATFLITLLRNNEVVVEFKVRLVEEFFKMREFIRERQTAEWLETRKQGKLTRKSETDTIKELVEYAKGQGSKNADMLYTVYSKLANQTVGIDGRDRASVMQLNNLSLIEHIILNVIKGGMAKDKHYKEIYQDCKAALQDFLKVSYLVAN